MLINLGIIILLLGLAAYFARIIPNLAQARARADAWDQRQARTHLTYQDILAGQIYIIVPAFDSIDHINELHPEKDHWDNQCPASYYQVAGISAVENYNGAIPYFK